MTGQKKYQVNPLIPSYLHGEWERMRISRKYWQANCWALLITLAAIIYMAVDCGRDLEATSTIAVKQAVEIKRQAMKIAQLECDTREQRKLLNMEYPSAKFNWECGR